MTVDDGYVPIERFGKDHWSTLAYAESVMMECAGFQIGFDPRMRQNRRHYRVMMNECRHPARPTSASDHGCMWNDKYSTVLSDGSLVSGHDDWHCVQDMAEAGLLAVQGRVIGAEDCEPGVTFLLSELGREAASHLREHKSQGGIFGTFRHDVESASRRCHD
jgi:hypothetical protein